MRISGLAKFAWGVLVYNLLVILWGAYVRATGSGAGCGSHWPLCNGEVLPRNPQVATLIEFSHRLSSGLAFLLVVALVVWVFRTIPKGKPARSGAAYTLLFIITESLVGAGLVLFRWVAHDISTGRVISISVHLINTFLLLSALTLTAWWLSGGERMLLKGHGLALWLFIFGFAGIIFIGVSGAVTALGDTLFPVSSLAEGVQQDFSPISHLLVRLRIWHPLIALIVGVFLMILAGYVAMFRANPAIRYFALALVVMVTVQWLSGMINVFLLAPVWMQLVHLLLADLTLIVFVLFAAVNFSESELRHSIVPVRQAEKPNPV